MLTVLSLCTVLGSKGLHAHSYDLCTPARCCFHSHSSVDHEVMRSRCANAYGVNGLNDTLATFPLALALREHKGRHVLTVELLKA